MHCKARSAVNSVISLINVYSFIPSFQDHHSPVSSMIIYVPCLAMSTISIGQWAKSGTSALPEVRGTADTNGGAYSPSRSILLVLTHDCIITQLYGPTGGDRHGWLNDADAGLRTNLDAV